MGHPVIMGKKLPWNSLGKPLQGRQNIINDKDQNFQPQGAIVAHGCRKH